MVTNSSAVDGWMPTTVSIMDFFTPIFTATAKPWTAGHILKAVSCFRLTSVLLGQEWMGLILPVAKQQAAKLKDSARLEAACGRMQQAATTPEQLEADRCWTYLHDLGTGRADHVHAHHAIALMVHDDLHEALALCAGKGVDHRPAADTDSDLDWTAPLSLSC